MAASFQARLAASRRPVLLVRASQDGLCAPKPVPLMPASVDHGERLEGARVHSRAPGLPAGLTAPLADPGPDPRRVQQRGGHQPDRAAANHDDVHRLVRPLRMSMSVKIINVKEYHKPVSVKILSVHG